MLFRQLAETQQAIHQQVAIDGGLTPKVVEQRGAAKRIQHLAGIGVEEWARANGHVLQDLDGDASETDGELRAESRVAAKTEEHLSMTPRHRLHLDPKIAVSSTESRDHFRRGRLYAVIVSETDLHSAVVGLVNERRR